LASNALEIPSHDHEEVYRLRWLEPVVRLFALTGWGQQEDRQQAIEAGFDAHFTKPVSSDEIIELLRRRLSPLIADVVDDN
jgi:CheY-like chemotaxis protein